MISENYAFTSNKVCDGTESMVGKPGSGAGYEASGHIFSTRWHAVREGVNATLTLESLEWEASPEVAAWIKSGFSSLPHPPLPPQVRPSAHC